MIVFIKKLFHNPNDLVSDKTYSSQYPASSHSHFSAFVLVGTPCRLVQWLRVNPNNDNTTSTGSSSSNENDDGLLLNVNPTYASSEHVPHAIAAGLEGQHTRTRNIAGT
ncbi:hypothetical protein Tco_1204874 [Tanacetum coccineum]